MRDARLDADDLPPDEGYLGYRVVVPDVLALTRYEKGVLIYRVRVVAPVCPLLRLKDRVEPPILVESVPGTDLCEGAPLLDVYEFCFPPKRGCLWKDIPVYRDY